MADVRAEITNNSIAESTDGPCNALLAALRCDMVAPIVDAVQGAVYPVSLVGNNLGYICRAVRSPTIPAAFGDGERATNARVEVDMNITIDVVSIVEGLLYDSFRTKIKVKV